MSYHTLSLPIFTAEAITGAEKLGVYDSLDADVIQSYMEYSLASLLFYAFKEGACSEQSARMTAMDAASKNAGELVVRPPLRLLLIFPVINQIICHHEMREPSSIW